MVIRATKTSNLSRNIAAELVEKRRCAFYIPYTTCLATKKMCCKLLQRVAESRGPFYFLQQNLHNAARFTTPRQLVSQQNHFSGTVDWSRVVIRHTSLLKVTQGTKTNKMAEGEESEIVAISVTLETKFSDEKKGELIKELEKNPCLWETGCPSYMNRVQRQKVADTVSAKFNVDPSALKSTIHGLRTSLIREMKREKEGKRSKWRFYEALSFMKEDIERSLKAKESQGWSPEDNEKMLDFYRDHDQLWNHHLESYRDRNLRDMNMKSLTQMFPERSEVEIKKQWQTLRTIFFREVKREEGSKSSGSGTDTVYTSPWKHFKSMMFLKGNDEIDPQVSTLQCKSVDTENEKPAKRARTTRRQHETPAKEIEDAKLELYREAIKCLQSPFPVSSSSLQSTPNDDITIFLKNIEVTLRKLPGRQLALAKRKIYGLVSDLEVQLYNGPQPAMSSSTEVTANVTPFSDATNMSWNYSSDHQYYY